MTAGDLFDFAPGEDAAVAHIPVDVRDLFDKLAHKLIADGWKHYSADAILHRVRWHFQIERGFRDYKCNNNWTSVLSRWWLAKNPSHADFFELRKSRQDEDAA